MIEAKIISIDDKVMVEWPPEPEKFDIKNMIFDVQAEILKRSVIAYDESKTIAEVENVEIVDTVLGDVCYVLLNGKCRNLELNQNVFIEPTENNKCQIIKI